jgi:hypothetical protein
MVHYRIDFQLFTIIIEFDCGGILKSIGDLLDKYVTCNNSEICKNILYLVGNSIDILSFVLGYVMIDYNTLGTILNIIKNFINGQFFSDKNALVVKYKNLLKFLKKRFAYSKDLFKKILAGFYK